MSCSTPVAKQKEGPDLDEIASNAYIFALPLVMSEVSRALSANTGQLISARTFPDEKSRQNRFQNRDTLYTSTWLDLEKCAYKLHVPAVQNRFLIAVVYDAWTHVSATLGTRISGSNASDALIVGPHWQGHLRSSDRIIKSQTHLVWILARIQTRGEKDYAAVHSIQDGFSLEPVDCTSPQLKDFSPSEGHFVPSKEDFKLSAQKVVQQMDPRQYFQLFSELLKTNPPSETDAPAIAQFRKLGINAGESYDIENLSPEIKASLFGAHDKALVKIKAFSDENAKKHPSSWYLPIPGNRIDNLGTDYLTRAVLSLIALGPYPPEDGILIFAFKDKQQQPLNGKYSYRLHFANGDIPPVKRYWSLTAYDAEGMLLPTRNPIGEGRKFLRDKKGEFDIYIQASSPGKEHELNWLPVKSGEPFSIVLRMFEPEKKAVDGIWHPPEIIRLCEGNTCQYQIPPQLNH